MKAGKGKVRKHAMKVKPSYSRLDAFARGMIWGMHVAGVPRDEMLKHAAKKDGTAPFRFVRACVTRGQGVSRQVFVHAGTGACINDFIEKRVKLVRLVYNLYRTCT